MVKQLFVIIALALSIVVSNAKTSPSNYGAIPHDAILTNADHVLGTHQSSAGKQCIGTFNVRKSNDAEAEWTHIGVCEWEDPFWYIGDVPVNGTLNIEKSIQNSGVYRIKPYGEYVKIHAEDSSKVYIEPYSLENSNGNLITITQDCRENGCSGSKYGTLINGKIVIPADYFLAKEDSSGEIVAYGDANRNCIITIPDYTEETWVNIGEGEWEDPIFSMGNGEPLKGTLPVEKSVQSPNTYRIQPYGKNIIIHAENPSKVYIETYCAETDNGVEVAVTQDCPENGCSNSLYGTLVNGQIVIPADCFLVSLVLSNDIIRGETNRNCVLKLPDGFNEPLPEDNGVFMGIVAFNDKLTYKPISLLDEATKDDFTTFVSDLQMGNATLLYYAIDTALDYMQVQNYPTNLNKAVLITFTDGLDQGSLAKHKEHRTSRGYATYLANRIPQTSIQGCPLEAYAIGLMSSDVVDEELFMYNLNSLASSDKNISHVNNISELQEQLTEIYENLNKEITQRVISITVPMMQHGFKYRFTLDGTTEKDKVTDSQIWFEGVFNIDNLSLENVTYEGFSSTSGITLKAEQNGSDVYLTFILNDCRDLSGNLLTVSKQNIDQWTYLPSHDVWEHNVENDKDGKINIEDIKSSCAIMFALDCSTSLGDLFPLVKTTANSFINRLVGADDPEPTPNPQYDLEPQVTPENGSQLSVGVPVVITLVFPAGTVPATENARASLECSEANYFETTLFTKGEADGTYLLQFGTNPKREGTYLLTIKEGTFVSADGAHANPQLYLSWQVIDTAVESILNDETSEGGVYNLNGIYVGESLENLPAGIYLVKGHKVAVSK